MALIECYECGKGISSLAHSCPDCGAPKKHAKKEKADGDFGMFADIFKNQKKEESGGNFNLTNKARWGIKLFVIYVCMFLFIGITGLAIALPGWGIGLIYGITTTVYVLNRGGPPAD
jgi:hypothetical protein